MYDDILGGKDDKIREIKTRKFKLYSDITEDEKEEIENLFEDLILEGDEIL